MSAGAMRASARAAFAACTARSFAPMPLSAPPIVPNAVRRADRITMSRGNLAMAVGLRVSSGAAGARASRGGCLGEIEGDVRKDDFVAFLHAGAREDLLAIDPALGHEGLSRPHGTREPRVDRADARGVPG